MPFPPSIECCARCSRPAAGLPSAIDAEGLPPCSQCVQVVACCDECGDRTSELLLTESQTSLCDRCLLGWSRCEDCDRYTRELISVIGGNDVCDGCAGNYSNCDDCGLSAAGTTSVDGDGEVCESCERDDYRSCADCSSLIRADYRYCADCDPGTADGNGIHSDHYEPEPVFHGQGPLFLGLELELKVPRDVLSEATAAAISHLGELGYLKRDHSIRPCGFELVTHPMSYSYACERFPWPMLTRLRMLGAHTDNTVGIHIHVSRAGFSSPAHVYRWLKFVYRNELPVTTLARRRHSPWAQFTPDARARAVTDAKGVRDLDASIPRYQAVNVLPAETFEMRMFASSVKPQQVKAALAFAAASVEYTRGLSASQIARRRGWEWAAFTAWVANRRRDYWALVAEMEALQCAS